jgi:FixJ family two-component response regulator
MINRMGWVVETVATVAKRGLGESEMVDCPAVAVVDDDESVRESLPDLLKELGFTARAFSSAEEFLVSGCIDQIRCLILDITMPGMTGLELESRLRLQGHLTPIIFITSRGNESARPKALEHGAVECLFKPFSDTALLAALNLALQRN